MLNLFKRKSAGSPPSPTPLHQEAVLKAVAQLELNTRRKLSSLLPGDRRSILRGTGMQFSEFRPYEYGDDVRHISWSVTARTQRPTVKIYEEERELNIVLAVDTSGSSLTGSGARRQGQFAEITMALGLSALGAGDRVSLLGFASTPRWFLPARRSRPQFLAAVTRLLQENLLGNPSDLRHTLLYLKRRLKHPSLVVILSDFLVPPFGPELLTLTRRHDVLLVQGYEDSEKGVLPRFVMDASDPETKRSFLVDGLSPGTKNRLADIFFQHRENVAKTSLASGAGYVCLSRQDDYLRRLILFFKNRGHARTL